MFCPKCKTGFREGFKYCEDCRADLVDNLREDNDIGTLNDNDVNNMNDIEQSVSVSDEMRNSLSYDVNNGDLEYLLTANDVYHAGMLESLLNSYGIPVVKKYKGAGGIVKVYVGNTNYGIDFYVPLKFFADAQKILENDISSDITEHNGYIEEDSENKEQENEEERRDAKRRRVLAFGVPLFYAITAILIVISLIFAMTGRS